MTPATSRRSRWRAHQVDSFSFSTTTVSRTRASRPECGWSSVGGHGQLFNRGGGSAGLALAGRRLGAVDNTCDCGQLLPAWSRDGSKVAWWAPAGLVSANANGRNRRLLARGIADIAASWAPDGS